MTGADYVVAVMSGDFVQRGAPAFCDKYLRAEMALLDGADLVLELPVSYACASAEAFAYGAAAALDCLGGIDFLSFGSETGEVEPLRACALELSEETSEYRGKLQSLLKTGLSFPAARKEALCSLSGLSFSPSLLDSPNNILGLEYIKALLRLKSPIVPVTVKRQGAGYHDTEIASLFSSASGIRALLKKELRKPGKVPDSVDKILKSAMPKDAALLLEKYLEEHLPLWEEDFSLLLRYQLMQYTPAELCSFADMSPELAGRIHARLNEFTDFPQFCAALKTRDITYTRICRALMHVLLHIQPQTAPIPSYARILGLRRDSSALLRKLKETARIPFITKAADYRRLLQDSKEGQKQFQQDLFASNLYHIVSAQKNGTAFVNDIQKPPVIL